MWRIYHGGPYMLYMGSPEKILIKMRAKTPGNGIAGRRGEF